MTTHSPTGLSPGTVVRLLGRVRPLHYLRSVQRQVAPAIPDDGPGGAARGRRAFVWIALTAFALFTLVARGCLDNMDSQSHRGANVRWVRAARNYDRPWAVLGTIRFVAFLVLAAVRLRRTLADGRRADAVAA